MPESEVYNPTIRGGTASAWPSQHTKEGGALLVGFKAVLRKAMPCSNTKGLFSYEN